MLSLCLKKESSFKPLEKTPSPPTRKPNGLGLITPYLLYQVEQQLFKDGLILLATYHVFH